MAATAQYNRNFGTFGAFTVVGSTRAATGADLEANVGYVHVLTVSGNSTTTEIAVQPALHDGARAITLAGLAVVQVLHIALGV